MRPAAVTLALLLLAASEARAGCSCEAGYVFRHVVYHAGYFGAHCTLPPMEMLRHRGMALLLDALVAEGIAKGELPDKRLDVRHAEDWSNPHSPVSISQNGTAMFIRGAQELELRDLLRTIAYFASPDYRSFNADAGRRPGVRDEALLRRLRTILDRSVPEPDVEAFRAREVTVKSIDDLAIVYRDGALRYVMGGEPLDIQPTGFMPVRIGHRYLLQDGNDVAAIESGAEVARHALPPRGNGPHECSDAHYPRVLPQWVNFYCGGTRRVFLTYSLARNRFFVVSVNRDPEWIPGHRARREDGLFVGECG